MATKPVIVGVDGPEALAAKGSQYQVWTATRSAPHRAAPPHRALAGWLDVVISRTRVACSRLATTCASRRVSS